MDAALALITHLLVMTLLTIQLVEVGLGAKFWGHFLQQLAADPKRRSLFYRNVIVCLRGDSRLQPGEESDRPRSGARNEKPPPRRLLANPRPVGVSGRVVGSGCPVDESQVGWAYRRAGGMSGLWSWRKTDGWYTNPRRLFGSAAVDEAESSTREG